MAGSQQVDAQSVAEANKQTIRDFFAALCVGEREKAREFFTPDATWRCPPSLPWPDFYDGRDAIFDGYFAVDVDLFESGVSEYDIDILNMVAEGDQVSVEMRHRSTGLQGETYETDHSVIYQLRDGRISGAHEYVDTLYLVESMMGGSRTVDPEADAIAEITRLMMTYAELQDQTDLAAVADLFLYGSFVVDKVETPFVGTEVIRTMKQLHDRMYPDGTLRTKHVTTNVRVDVDLEAGRASAKSYFTVFQATDELPLQTIMAGRYSDTFHLVGGTWWFDRRYVHTDLIGNITSHVNANPMDGFQES